MKSIFLVAVCLLLASVRGLAADLPPGWGTNYASALGDAKTRQQPVLVWFTASWCGPCRMMARRTLTNAIVTQALANVSPVVVDIDEHADLAQQADVSAVPTFRLLSPAGEQAATITGYQGPEAFVAWLTNGIRQTEEAVARQRKFEVEVLAAERLLQDASPRLQTNAVACLLELSAAPAKPAREKAQALLTSIAETRPVLLLDGLNHPRLAVRIETANILRKRLGDSFDVDPWADAASRQKAVALWREKLSPR